MRWPHLSVEVLPLLVLISPLIGLLTAGVMSRWNQALVRPMALANSLTTIMLVVVVLFVYRPGANAEKSGFVRQMTSSTPWLQGGVRRGQQTDVPSPKGIDVRLSFGVDGMSAWAALLLTVTVWAAICFPGRIRDDLFCAYCSWLMLTESLLLASLMAGDVITIVIFFELALLPVYLLVGVCGEGQHRQAAGSLWIWQFAGSACSLFGATLLAVARPWMQSDLVVKRAPMVFDEVLLVENIQQLLVRSEAALQIWSHLAPWGGLFLMFGFAVRLPVYPFQGWYVSALSHGPAGAAALIAAIFPLAAVHGWLRLASPFFNESGTVITGLLSTCAVIGLWRAALVSQSQNELRKLVVTISVGLLSLACLGVNTASHDAVRGGWLLVYSQGLATAIGIFVAEMIEVRTRSREYPPLGSWIGDAPRLAMLILVIQVVMAELPLLANFAAIYLIALSTAEANGAVLVAEVIGLSLLAAGVLRALGASSANAHSGSALRRPAAEQRSTWFDRFEDSDHQPRGGDSRGGNVSDLRLREVVTVVPLFGLLVLVNLVPHVVLDGCDPLMRRLIRRSEKVSFQTRSTSHSVVVEATEPGGDSDPDLLRSL